MKYENRSASEFSRISDKASPAEVNEAVKNEIFLNKYCLT